MNVLAIITFSSQHNCELIIQFQFYRTHPERLDYLFKADSGFELIPSRVIDVYVEGITHNPFPLKGIVSVAIAQNLISYSEDAMVVSVMRQDHVLRKLRKK